MIIDYQMLRYAVVGVMSLALLFAVYAVASALKRTTSRLGMRGLRRRRALENNPLWAAIEPLVRWLGLRMGGLLSDSFHERLDHQLALAGDFMGLTPGEYVSLSIVSFIGGLLFGVVAGGLSGMGYVMVIVVGPVGLALPYLAVSSAVERRLKQINHGLPYMIDLLALSMSAGQDFPGAVRQVVEKSSDPDDALVEEMGRMLQELQIGRTRKQVLVDLAERAPLDSVNEFVNALVQAEERGNPVADVLLVQAGVSRTRRTARAEDAAAKAGVAMVAPLFLLFFCIMLLVMGPLVLQLAHTHW